MNPCTKTRTNLNLAIQSMKHRIKASKLYYFNNTLNNFIRTSPSKFWSYLNPKRQTENPASKEDSLEIANELNDYFASVFSNDNGIVPHQTSRTTKHIESLTVTETGVLNLLLNLDTKKGPGPDNIPNSFLKRYAE